MMLNSWGMEKSFSGAPKLLDRKKYLTMDEAQRLREHVAYRALQACKRGHKTWVKYWMLVDLALGTGARVGELVQIRIKDVLLNRKMAYVRIKSEKKKKYVTREVPITKELAAHLKEFIEFKKIWKEDINPEACLMAYSGGKPYTVAGLQSMWHKACEELVKKGDLMSWEEEIRGELRTCSPSIHSARHFFGAYLYSQSKNIRLVQQVLGHNSIMTTSIYSHVLPEETEEAVNGLGLKLRIGEKNGEQKIF